MREPAALTITATPWSCPDGAALRAAQQAELDLRYGTANHEPGTPPSAADITVLLVGRLGPAGEAVGCGALRQLEQHCGEVKRMYVVPRLRGTGVAVALLRELEQQARGLGWTVLKLETGTAQVEAIRFYQREGYDLIDNFGPYAGEPMSRCYQRAL